jgi:hypothetical protein
VHIAVKKNLFFARVKILLSTLGGDVPIVGSLCGVLSRDMIAVDHTASKTLDPIRTPLLSDARPGQYWAGGPPGNTTELTAFSKSHLDIPIVGCMVWYGMV